MLLGDGDQLLRELVLAVGAALLVANVWALVRRRRDGRLAAARTVARTRPGSPVRGNRRSERDDTPADLAQAPIARSVTYAIVGFIVMIWSVASLLQTGS